MSQRRYAALSHTRSSDLRALQLVSDVRPGMVPGDRSGSATSDMPASIMRQCADTDTRTATHRCTAKASTMNVRQ